MKTLASALVLMAVLGVSPDLARADASEYASKESWSPEGYLLSFGVGAYRPDPGSAGFDLVYPNQNGPILLAEFDFFLYRIPFIGPIGIGVAGGWAGYKGTACVADTVTPTGCTGSTQGTKFSLFPINAMVVLRIDALARKTRVPFVFSGKVGYNTVFFKEENSGNGRSHGFGWAAQLALELNFINPRRANALDEDWGINSSFFFFELGGSDTNSRAPLGDKLYFTGGVGVTF